MKPINLSNLVVANNNLSKELRDKLFETWGVNPKNEN